MPLCCCCCEEGTEEETTPLPVSAKPPKQAKVLEKYDLLVVKKVDVAEYDERFSDIAELYNQQVKNRQTMTDCLSKLRDISGSNTLTGCFQALRTKYSSYDPQIKMTGYKFSLAVKESDDLPEELQEAQELTKNLSLATKLLIGSQTKLDGMVFSVAQEKSEMESKIKQTHLGYLDQIRLIENLEDNIRNINSAKQFSKDYDKEATGVLEEIATITGAAV
ncbi:uncharacterized protein [Hyperolius riggenbachi]|uniref:uncharacterized protein n=1 Tax=Hyperolius riggenbachi TaxID=752182 RepID=UPI0035A2F151